MAIRFSTSPASTTSGSSRIPNGEEFQLVNVRTEFSSILGTLLITSYLSGLAICLPKCQNNGICIAPGQCECSENFHGPQCQHEKKLCLQRAPLAANSQIKCSATDCTVTCRKGYRFPDGSTVTNMVCKDGEWTPSKIGWDSVPDCQRKSRSFAR